MRSIEEIKKSINKLYVSIDIKLNSREWNCNNPVEYVGTLLEKELLNENIELVKESDDIEFLEKTEQTFKEIFDLVNKGNLSEMEG
jgi:hypothetical protein